MIELDTAGARRLRLQAQGVSPRQNLLPAQVVQRMVALQGQDLPAVLRAIAIRSRPDTTVDDVRAAFNAGELVRGWTQPGTLFATTPQGPAALTSPTAERTKRVMTHKQSEKQLNGDVIQRATLVASHALEQGLITRATLMELGSRPGSPPMVNAPQEKSVITLSGPQNHRTVTGLPDGVVSATLLMRS